MATQPIPTPAPDPAPPAPAPVTRTTTAPVGWVIAAMILFWPTGIPALLASHRAARALGAADAVTADREASNARRWGIISVAVGAALIVLSVVVSIVWAFLAVLAFHDYRDGGVWMHDGPGWSDERSFGGPGPGLPERPDSNR